MYTIRGLRKNSGTLDNGKAWENYTLFCTKATDNEKIVGEDVCTVKCPVKILASAFPTPEDALGAQVNINYDVRTYNGQQKPVVVGIDVF